MGDETKREPRRESRGPSSERLQVGARAPRAIATREPRPILHRMIGAMRRRRVCIDPSGKLPDFPPSSSTPAAAPSGSVLRSRESGRSSRLLGSHRPSGSTGKRANVRARARRSSRSSRRPWCSVLLYTPTADSTDFDGDTPQRIVVRPEPRHRLRRPLGEGPPWLRRRCAPRSLRSLVRRQELPLGLGSTTSFPLKAIAWEAGKAWLYAVRSDTSVTFVLPHATETSVDTMAGAPLTARGGFTRVTLPLGPLGAGSVLAQVSSLSFCGSVRRSQRSRSRRSRDRAGCRR